MEPYQFTLEEANSLVPWLAEKFTILDRLQIKIGVRAGSQANRRKYRGDIRPRNYRPRRVKWIGRFSFTPQWTGYLFVLDWWRRENSILARD